MGRLAAFTARRPLKRGATLFRKGEAATGMYVVVYGEIKLIATTPVRGARLFGVVGPGRSFGEPVMFLERPTQRPQGRPDAAPQAIRIVVIP